MGCDHANTVVFPERQLSLRSGDIGPRLDHGSRIGVQVGPFISAFSLPLCMRGTIRQGGAGVSRRLSAELARPLLDGKIIGDFSRIKPVPN